MYIYIYIYRERERERNYRKFTNHAMSCNQAIMLAIMLENRHSWHETLSSKFVNFG